MIAEEWEKAQRSEIGLLLKEEEEKLAKERQIETAKLKGKLHDQNLTKLQKENIVKKIEELSEGSSAEKVAQKVRVSPSYIAQAKKIKEIAKDNPIIAEEWEKAQRSEIGLLLLEEEEKLAKERQIAIATEKARIIRGENGKFEEVSESVQNETLSEKINEISEGRATKKVGTKVKVGYVTLSKAKKIKEIADGYKDDEGKEHPPEPMIAEEWEKAQRSEIGLLLLDEEEKIAKERQKEITENKPRAENGKFLKNEKESIDTMSLGKSTEIVGKKVKVGGMTLTRAKKIKKIADGYTDDKGKVHAPEPLIAEDWEKAQRSEIGLLLLEEESKLAKERRSEIAKIQADMQIEEGKKDFQKISDEEKKNALAQKIDEIAKGKATNIVGTKIKVSGRTLSQAKKIKEIAKDNPIIAEEWEKAQRSEIGLLLLEEEEKLAKERQIRKPKDFVSTEEDLQNLGIYQF